MQHIPSHNTPLGDRLLGWENDSSQPQQPGEALWSRIEKDLPRPSRRRLLGWWWAGPLLVAIAAGGVYFTSARPPAPYRQTPAADSAAPCQEAPPLPGFFPATTTPPTAAGRRQAGRATNPIARQNPESRIQAAHTFNTPTAEFSSPTTIVLPDIPQTPDAHAAPVAAQTPALNLVYNPVSDLVNPPRPVSRAVSPLDVQPWLQKPHNGNLFLSLHTALTDNNYVWQQTAPGNLSPVRSRQQLSWRNEWGGSIRYAYGRWSLSAGVSTYSGQLRSLSRYRRMFDPGQEQTTPDGSALSTFSLAIANPYGDADVNVDIQRDTMADPPPQATLFFTVAATQQMRAWQLPLLLGYHLPLGKMHLGIFAGPAFEFHQLQTMQARVQVFAPGQFALRPVGLPRQQITTGLHFVSWSLALELSYPLNNEIRLYVRPFGQYSARALQSAQTTKYMRWGSQLGISYRIFAK